MIKLPSILEMLQSGVHFGHQISRRHPKMDPYIFGERNGVHVIDLEKTRVKLEEVLATVQKMATEGKIILFASTKPQAREIVKQAAIDCGMPYLVSRWLGGLITNFSELKKLIQKYNTMKTEQASGEWEKYTKKEQIDFAKKLETMHETLAGLSSLTKLPDALFIPALQREKTAVAEANKMNVAIIGVADTNANPNKATLVIPANDDAVNSIKMIVGLVAEAIKAGKVEWEKTKVIGAIAIR
ncbi:MAG: 30S ribosomal protein S2 [Candidatus Magasanikbacteria bacterium]|nr:30S ribosomal protein S2 [Candidatus Magasanikbacteria bacterium]